MEKVKTKYILSSGGEVIFEVTVPPSQEHLKDLIYDFGVLSVYNEIRDQFDDDIDFIEEVE